jgi:hypothetical protein
MKFELQFVVKIDSQSVLSAFTHKVLPFRIVKTGLSGLHNLYTIKFLFFCHLLLGKSGFMIWRSGWGTRIRTQKTTVDIFWSFAIFILLFAHLGMLLPMTGLHMDGDYNGFVNNVPFAHWQANALLLLFASINAYMLYRTIPHLVKVRRKFVRELAEEHRQSSKSQSAPADG